ncbi:MAG: sialidase family protein [Gemmatimonas sp.]
MLMSVARCVARQVGTVLCLAVGSPSLCLAQVAASPPNGLVAADLAGLRLRSIGPASMSGRVIDMDVVESNPYVWYVGSATGGVWRTRDNGVTWESLFDAMPVHSVGDVAVFQPNPDIVWVGTGDRANRQSVSWGDGVYKSTDAGKTWTNVGLRASKHIGRIVLHPTNPDLAYVAAQGSVWGPGGDRGVYRTVDGGRTWSRTLVVDDETGATDVAIDGADPRILYAATYQRRRSPFGFDGGGPGSALWKSTDAGSTWTKLSGNGLPSGEYGRIGIAIYRKNTSTVVVSIEQGARYNASTAYIQRKAGLYRSDDKGATWTFLSDWNPRPMYASQPLIDPNDDKRIYMLNAYSFSDDGGKTFTAPRTTTHGDDRFVWVDPKDSRHVVKLDDGGIGISYDRGNKFLYVSSLPLSQFYRVALDNAVPFNVYGGLQDNGCWMGPSASWNTTGILNDHWSRLCGGDGFWAVPDLKRPGVVYSGSQFLGLQRNSTTTWEVQDIRPGDPQGHISGRRNWDTWGKPGATQVLGNAMHPANWDSPIVVSAHDTGTIYVGMQHLFRSRDRGITWTDLGDMTTGVDRSTLPLMGRTPSENTLSIDDGVPYFPGITSLAESPRRKGVLYVGSDDGRFSGSRDGGATWQRQEARFPGLPASSWFAGVEPSRHADGTVYVTVDNHRANDFRNYVFMSKDFGQTWTSIVGDLPSERVARTIREDPRNANLLYLATEFGVFWSPDRGAHWIALRHNMPTMPFNDLAIHPRDNALVLASHARGIWILDQVNAFQELTAAVMAKASHLFTMQPAYQMRSTNLRPHTGDMIFRGENPANGAYVDYWLSQSGANAVLTVQDSTGEVVQELKPVMARGVNRVVWNLRYADLPLRGGGGDDDDAGPRATTPGPLVMPGTYTVRLVAGGETSTRRVVVREDPRITISRDDRRAWTSFQRNVASLAVSFAPVADRARRATGRDAQTVDLKRQAAELLSRISTLYGASARWTGRPTADQRTQLVYYQQMAKTLSAASF